MVQRTDFGTLRAVIDPPDLIEIQTRSYSDFLQMDLNPTRRKRPTKMPTLGKRP